MVQASVILTDIAHGAVNDVFRSYKLSFRGTKPESFQGGRTYGTHFTGPNALGLLQFSVEEDVLAATSTPFDRRSDLVKELTNVVMGCIEAELLRRGVVVQYKVPAPVAAPNFDTFKRGSDGVVCYFEDHSGRVAIGIELNLSPGTVLETSPTRRLPAKEPSKLNLPTGGARRGSVLVVDDSTNARLSVTSALSGAGFDIVQAASGEEALRLLGERDDIRMMFTDLHMGGMQGGELIRRVKSEPKLAWMPVVVLTASPAALAQVDPKQIVTCLIKPISPAAVVSLAHRVVAVAS